ncbi:MAG: MlaD family protein [Candidatus Omnitrophica bacterium]|nr:MlaD family protein [Candidatus Omnitrophota bacterium]
MVFGKSSLELKVGIFVFVGLIILATFVLLIGNFKTWTSGYRINFVFNFVNGVKIGAPIRFAGVDVGEVRQIRFIFNPKESKTKVNIEGWINKEVMIPRDSTVWVNTLGLLGEKYIEIMPGKDFQNILAKDGSLEGVDPVPMHEVAVLARNIADDLETIIQRIKDKEGTIGRLLYDNRLYQEIAEMIKNKEGTIGKLFYDDSLYKEIEALIKDLRQHPWKLLKRTKQ